MARLELILIGVWAVGFVLGLANVGGSIIPLGKMGYIQIGDILSLGAAAVLAFKGEGKMRWLGVGLIVLTVARVLWIGSPLIGVL